MKYFGTETEGLNADLERHNIEKQNIDEKIAELENRTDEMGIVLLKAYKHFKSRLEESKAEVASKIGKKQSRKT